MTIRKAQSKDIQNILKLMLNFSGAYPAEYVNSKKRGSIRWLLENIIKAKDKIDSASFVFEEAGEVIGHIAYYKDDRCFEGGVYELRALIVNKKYQHKGCGTLLTKFIEQELKMIKARLIWLQTNKNETKFYQTLGYKVIAVYKNYWGKGRDRYVLGKYF